jgi:Na+-driven multidrug efflux pump/anti-sigma regulatory factor (Ser/Thr protein kinase)
MTQLISNDLLVRKIVRRYIFPGIAAQLGVKLGNVINTIIIGHLFGTDGLAVMSLVSPLELIMMSIGSLICVAGAIHAGFAVAKNNDKKASEHYSESFWAVLSAGFLISLLGIIFAEDLSVIFGADSGSMVGDLTQIEAVTAYIRTMLCGGVFMTAVYLSLNFLKVIGHPGKAMSMLFIMSGVNVAAAFHFAVNMKMGIQGVALGTALSYCCAFVYGQWAFHKSDSGVKLKAPGHYILKNKKSLISGVPSALNNILRAVSALGINLIIITLLPNKDVMLSAVAVSNSVLSIINAFVFGISQSTLQIAGIAYSEKDYKTVNIAIKNIFIIGNIILGICAALMIIFSSRIGGLFGAMDTNESAFACISIGCLTNLYLCNNIFTNFFSAVRRNTIAIVIVSLRLTLFLLLPALLICYFTKSGIGIWVGMISAEVFGFLSILIYSALKRRKNHKLSRFLLLDEDNRVSSLDFSVKADEKSAAEASERITQFTEEAGLPIKTVMRIGMAVEEIVVLVCAHAGIKDEFIDFRIFRNTEKLFLRVRYGGGDFNPVKYSYEHFDDNESDALGMNIVMKLTENATYTRTLGVNNVIFEIT